MEKKRPGREPDEVFKTRMSPYVSLAVWNEAGDLTFRFNKRFFNKTNNTWMNGNSFFLNEIAAFQSLITEAILWANDIWRKTPKEQRHANKRSREKEVTYTFEEDFPEEAQEGTSGDGEF